MKGVKIEVSRSSADSVRIKVNSESALGWKGIVFTLMTACLATFSSVNRVAIAICAVFLMGWMVISSGRRITSESVLVVRDLGVECSARTSDGTVVERRFIARDQIRTTLIMEGFTATEVVTYIAIELAPSNRKHTGKLILPFQHFILPINSLGPINNEIRNILAIK